ncbi:MAG: LegC family aminotransferase [Anaerocolumna aminovalerica]|nr:LegC family aminotransferase [Anaerocolumna aminovalerica]MDU6263940.1 LegC family aminotransferase [Anaerocolumna aminovalerica]
MMGHFIPLSVPNLKGKELEYVTHAVATEWVSTAGPYISDFEHNIAEYVGASEAVACQSGTAGLHLALIACGISRGDEVIVPTLTFIAAVNPVKYLEAEPVFMDCDDSLAMDPCKLEAFCEQECFFKENILFNKKSGRQIKAIIVVHIFGNMADMERIMQIAQRYNLKVIEDATEALGTYYISGMYKDKFAGTIGDIGVYSFNGNKIITTGGGGMIVSNNKEYINRCRYLSTQAKDDTLYFLHDEIGYNYRMTNLQAALGLAQLEQLESFISTKQTNYMDYQSHGIPLLKFRDTIRPNYWFYSYLTHERDNLLQYLSNQNIQTRPIWRLIHTLRPYKEAQAYNIEKALYYYDHVLNLPCSTNLTGNEVAVVVNEISKFVKNN